MTKPGGLTASEALALGKPLFILDQHVPGMPEFYRALNRSHHASFHYISASP